MAQQKFQHPDGRGFSVEEGSDESERLQGLGFQPVDDYARPEDLQAARAKEDADRAAQQLADAKAASAQAKADLQAAQDAQKASDDQARVEEERRQADAAAAQAAADAQAKADADAQAAAQATS